MTSLDFVSPTVRTGKDGKLSIVPSFKVCRSKDLMIRGGKFYAIWDARAGLWSTDEYDVAEVVDRIILDAAEQRDPSGSVSPHMLKYFANGSWKQYRSYIQNSADNYRQLDASVTFQNTSVERDDFVSRRLPYNLEAGDTSAYDELMGVLYDPSERDKLEWAIGAIIAGDAKDIQKFIVLYGESGAGKSTFLNILQKLFEGYFTAFDARSLGVGSNAFSMEPFKNNPLLAIQHDGDLSRIEDNTKLNSIVSHEIMSMNEKNKPMYAIRLNAFLIMGSNKPVKITDAKSGIIRRLIDVHPSGRRIEFERYMALMGQINFELGAIAYSCLHKYRKMGASYYDKHRPLEMIQKTDVFYNFVEHHYEVFEHQDATTLKQAYSMYKAYCEDALVEFRLPMYKFREELKNYFREYADRCMINGESFRNRYSGFLAARFTSGGLSEVSPVMFIETHTMVIESMLADCQAQYTRVNEAGLEIPIKPWEKCTTALKDLDPRELHYVKPPENHIVIDFDLKNDDGEKDRERNLEAAAKFPPTYAEWSKGGSGIHLHYIWDGDVSTLNRVYSPGIEVKVFTGGASLRRKFSESNGMEVAHIRTGLPLREEKVLTATTIENEKHLRSLIEKALRKEVHSATKPNIDFIAQILDEAYKSGMEYDVSNLRQDVLAFATQSTNQAGACIRIVKNMRFVSEEPEPEPVVGEGPLTVFDCEVYPNLFVVCYKLSGAPKADTVALVNPTPEEIEPMFEKLLVGFNNRRYDNHMIYARHLGWSNEQLYRLSLAIIGKEPDALFREAYNLSYGDIYDFTSLKQSLKRYQIELGLDHLELGLPWDEPVADEDIPRVVEYCINDVDTTDKVLLARSADLQVRKMLSALSGLSVNTPNNSHSAKIVFGGNRPNKSAFVYTDLSKQFPGYEYSYGKSTYRGEVTGEGGLVMATPGMYSDVSVYDVESMHPTSIIELNLFGSEYTERFGELLKARLAIKHKDYDTARGLLGGALAPYLDDESSAKEVAGALKIVLNSVYGLTSASFDNPFRDMRNKDNIVAKRGALFMLDLRQAMLDRGYDVIHIKTDSIKIPGGDKTTEEFVKLFGSVYGYRFEVEAVYDKMCLVNKAVYVARLNEAWREPGDTHGWTATGAQFAHPYVFKTLFSKERVTFDDLVEIKTVTTSLWIELETGERKFVGRAGGFVPVLPGAGGGHLVREKDGKFDAASGTKGHLWAEAQVIKELGLEDQVDYTYYDKLANEAVETISEFGDFGWLTD